MSGPVTKPTNNPGGYIVQSYDIKAQAVEVLSDPEADHVILYCLGLNVSLRVDKTEALRVASDIQEALR